MGLKSNFTLANRWTTSRHSRKMKAEPASTQFCSPSLRIYLPLPSLHSSFSQKNKKKNASTTHDDKPSKRKALELFSEMQGDVLPNEVTFVVVLTACSHSGLVDEGLKIFNSMKENYGIHPGVEHYECLVDLFARAGLLVEAKILIDNMPMEPSQSIWGSVVGACRAHGNMELAEIALRELLKSKPNESGGYILLSNIYATWGRWSCSDKIKELMESRGVKKIAGCNSVVVDGVFHDFAAVD